MNEKQFLISWIQTFPDFVDCTGLNGFSGPDHLQRLLSVIDADYFSENPKSLDNIQQLQTLWRNMVRYVQSSVKNKIWLNEPNFVSIVRRSDQRGIFLMLKLALAVSVISPERKLYMQRILDLKDTETKQFIMLSLSSMYSVEIPSGSEYVSEKENIDRSIGEDDSHVLRLEEQCAFLTGQIEKLKNHYELAMDTVSEKQASISDMQKTVENLTKYASDKETHDKRLAQLEHEKSEMSEKIASLEEQLNQQTAIVTMMQADLRTENLGFTLISEETTVESPTNDIVNVECSHETNINITACREKMKRLQLESELIMDSLVSFSKIRLNGRPSDIPQSWMGKQRQLLGIF